MSPIDEPASFEPQAGPAESRRRKSTPPPPEERSTSELVAFTLDAASGRIVAVERVDATGGRSQLSDEDRARLTRTNGDASLQSLVEQAFEAGIDCVLGGEAGEGDQPESAEDIQLRRLLLQSLIERSAAKRLLQREVLTRAIVGALIQQASASPPESTVAH